MPIAKPRTARPLSLFLDGTPRTPSEVRVEKLWWKQVDDLLKLAHDEHDEARSAVTNLRLFFWNAQKTRKLRGRKVNQVLRRISGLADLLITRLQGDVGTSAALRELGVSLPVECRLVEKS